MNYIVGSLNARHLSGVGTHDIRKMAEIIISEHFDILALQEVKKRKAIELLKNYLPNWEGYYGKSQSDSDYGSGQDSEGGGLGFAYLWNTKKVRECSRDGQPEIITRFSSNITRKPFYGRFTPSGLGGPFCEFRLINVHLWYGENSTYTDIPKRLSEFETVTKEIYSYLSNRRYGDFRQAFTIVLGDYNFSAVFCQGYEKDNAKYFIKTVQEKETTISRDNARYVNNYDHFSYDERIFSATKITYDRVESVGKYFNYDFEKHWKEFSDHVPIKIEINLNPRR